LNNYVKKINELLDEYEKAHSTVLTYRVPTEEIERMLSRNDSWIIKLLQITHKHLNNGDALTSNLDFPPQKHITDIFYTNVPTNEYFTLSHQNQLDYILIIGGAALFFVLKDKRYFDECMLQIGELIDNIYVASNCSTKGIENDYRTLVQMLDNAFHSTITGNDNGEMIRSLCYGTEMYICAFTERILRSVYVSLIQKERYVQESKLTFGALLSSENNPLKIIFGESLLRHFNYFFCVDNEGYNVGCNLRNRLAHLTEDSNELLSYEYVSKLLYLLVSIINSLYLYFCFNKPFKEGK